MLKRKSYLSQNILVALTFLTSIVQETKELHTKVKAQRLGHVKNKVSDFLLSITTVLCKFKTGGWKEGHTQTPNTCIHASTS